MKNRLCWSRVTGKFGTRVACAFVAVAVVAGSVKAEPRRFDNSEEELEHFMWCSGPDYEEIGLEITSDADSQTGAWGGEGQFRQCNNPPNSEFVSAPPGGLLEVDGDYGLFLVGVNEGVSIPSGAALSDFGIIYYPGYGTWLPEGEQIYLGVQFPMVDGTHYGWIGVVYNTAPEGQHQLDAFAWGYETVPGQSILAGAPEPGTLALLAFGALLRRRR